MNKFDLIELGFSQNEAKVYLSLIKFGSSTAREVINEVKLHKKIVYENIERLIEKGLVTFVQEGRTKVFKIADPNMLVELYLEKIKQLENKKRQAQRIAQEIRVLAKQERHKTEAMVFRGKNGIRTFYNELIRLGEDYLVFGAPSKSIEVMDEHFWLNLVKKKKYNKIKARIIFNQSLRKYGEKIKDETTQIKYLDKDFEPMTEINIQKDRIATIVWSEEPTVFLIIDKIVAESYKKYFEKMWEKSAD